MATAAATKEFVFEWEGRDRNGKAVRGETRAAGENQVMAALRRQGVTPGCTNGPTEAATPRRPATRWTSPSRISRSIVSVGGSWS